MHIVLKDPVPNVSVLRYTNGTGSNGNGEHGASQAPVGYDNDGLQHNLSVYQADEKRARLRLETNHAIIDGLSTNVLLRDFCLAYSGGLDLSGPLYRDFINYVEQQSREADHEFWPKYLQGVEPCLFSTSEGSRKGASTFAVNVEGIDAKKIHTFCAKWKVTTATVIQAAWALVLHRHTGATVPCFGVLTSGRDVPVDGVDEMLGPLICLIPCRVRLDRSHSVLETLKTIQEDYADCLPHQTYALADTHKALGVDTSGLFNTALSFQRGGEEFVSSEDENRIQYRGGQDLVEYDVYTRALDGVGELGVLLEFWEERVSVTDGRHVAGLLSAALSAIVKGPERDIMSIDLPTETD